MMQAVRARLTAGRSGLARPEGRTRSGLISIIFLVALAALGPFGCAGGQSGAEDCLDPAADTFANNEKTDGDEDGGVDDDEDGGMRASITNTGPEAADGPISCPPPDDEL